jgi:hypothetical protein
MTNHKRIHYEKINFSTNIIGNYGTRARGKTNTSTIIITKELNQI